MSCALLTEKERQSFIHTLYRQQMSDSTEAERQEEKIKRMLRDASGNANEGGGVSPPTPLLTKEEEEYVAQRRRDQAAAQRRYQVQLEVHWLEEWAATTMNDNINNKSNDDDNIDQSKEDTGDGVVCASRSLSHADRRVLLKRALIERLDYRKPLPYIIGSQPFYGCEIRCRPPVLCPSRETEMWTQWLVEEHLKPCLRRYHTRHDDSSSSSAATRPIRLLDMCCGTGCVGIALARHLMKCSEGRRRPVGCWVIGVDVDPAAVQIAKENAEINGLTLLLPSSSSSCAAPDFHPHHTSNPMPADPLPLSCGNNTPDDSGFFYTAMQGDMFEPFVEVPDVQEAAASSAPLRLRAGYPSFFDIIVCNPPHVLQQEYDAFSAHRRMWESELALVGDERRRGSEQYRYYHELCHLVGPALLAPLPSRHPALVAPNSSNTGVPSIVVQVGRQGSLVATLMERDGSSDGGGGACCPWRDVQVHLDLNQEPRWIAALRSP